MIEHPLYAPEWVSRKDLPQELYSEILPGLFQGGTDDEDTLDKAKPLAGVHEARPFDVAVTLYAWAHPFGWGVEELRYGFPDAHPRHADMGKVIAAARWAHERWKAGERVLIRCQAGLNRSGLVTALVLMLDGHTANEAIALIRKGRSSFALCNDDFVEWLFEDGAAELFFAEAKRVPFSE